MAEARIPVDIFNPGQVLACLGFLEAADILVGDAAGAVGGFDWSDESDVRFVLRTSGGICPVEKVLEFLDECRVVVLAPKGSGCSDQWGSTTVVDADGVFPVSPTVREGAKRNWIKDSALPVRLESSAGGIVLVSHWADVENGRERLKTWGGAQGKSGASRMQDLLDAARPQMRAERSRVCADPFGLEYPVGGFRLNLHRDYIPIDIGFTLNAHKSTMDAMGNPLVEIMAVIGLENARPMVIDRLAYRYGAWRGVLDPALARPTLGCIALATEARTFFVQLGEPNDYDRSIRHVTQESSK